MCGKIRLVNVISLLFFSHFFQMYENDDRCVCELFLFIFLQLNTRIQKPNEAREEEQQQEE